jgi:hypothetical protein
MKTRAAKSFADFAALEISDPDSGNRERLAAQAKLGLQPVGRGIPIFARAGAKCLRAVKK